MEKYSPRELRMCRQFAGLTQAQAAKIAGVARGTWNRYELGHAHMPRRVRERCSRFLSEDPLQIRRGEFVRLAAQWADTEADVLEQVRYFAQQLLNEWKYHRPFYKDKHGRSYRNPNFNPKKDDADEQG